MYAAGLVGRFCVALIYAGEEDGDAWLWVFCCTEEVGGCDLVVAVAVGCFKHVEGVLVRELAGRVDVLAAATRGPFTRAVQVVGCAGLGGVKHGMVGYVGRGKLVVHGRVGEGRVGGLPGKEVVYLKHG